MTRRNDIQEYKTKLYRDVLAKALADIFATEHPAYYSDRQMVEMICESGIPCSAWAIWSTRRDRGFPSSDARRKYNRENKNIKVDD